MLACTSLPLTSSLASFIYCYLTSCLPHVYLVRTCLFTSCLPVFLPLLPHVYLLLLTYRTEGKAEEGEEKKKKTPEKPSGKKPKSADASGGKPSGKKPKSADALGGKRSGKKPKSADASAAAPPEGSSSGAASSSSGAAASSSSNAVELVHLRHVFTSCLPLHYIDTSALPHVYLTLHRVYHFTSCVPYRRQPQLSRVCEMLWRSSNPLSAKKKRYRRRLKPTDRF